MNEKWKCPLCDFEIPRIGPDYYSYGNDRRIQMLEEEVEILNRALTHIIINHLMVCDNGQSSKVSETQVNEE